MSDQKSGHSCTRGPHIAARGLIGVSAGDRQQVFASECSLTFTRAKLRSVFLESYELKLLRNHRREFEDLIATKC